MDTRSNPSPSVTMAESDLRTRFLQAAERLWPGSTRIAKLMLQHDAWLKKKQSNGRSWYDIITDTLDEELEGRWKRRRQNTFTMPMPAMTQREIRKALLQNGHLPIPVQGKRPLLLNWQNLSPNEEMIDGWGDQGDNTGVLCKRTAALTLTSRTSRQFRLFWIYFRASFLGRHS